MDVAVLTVFSLVGGFLFGVNLVGTNMPDGRPGPYDSRVRIAVGLNGDKGWSGSLRHAAGNAPLVNAFNENQNWCGSSDNKHPYITSGSFRDMTIRQSDVGPGEQATSLHIIPTSNELCIAYISQTWADGTHRGWIGDMGRGCGRDWYYSNIVVGNDHKPSQSLFLSHTQPHEKAPVELTRAQSACTWVDHDHSHGITTAALQIHMQDFTNLTTNFDHEPGYYCTWPTMLFQADADAVGYHASNSKITPGLSDFEYAFWDGKGASASSNHLKNDANDGEKVRRSRLSRRSGLAAFSHLIASPHDRHSAQELCESGSSHGPDFVSSSEGIFCDMDAKTHWPLCDRTTENECYHWDTHSLVLGDDRLPRNYSHVEEWE